MTAHSVTEVAVLRKSESPTKIIAPIRIEAQYSVAKCAFHLNDKGSLYIYHMPKEPMFFHCFGCGVHGTANSARVGSYRLKADP